MANSCHSFHGLSVAPPESSIFYLSILIVGAEYMQP